MVPGYMASDCVHMFVSISSKYAVSEVIGYLKGKSGAPVSMVGFELVKVIKVHIPTGEA
jgi:REP element-mobilizing transposase RayT